MMDMIIDKAAVYVRASCSPGNYCSYFLYSFVPFFHGIEPITFEKIASFLSWPINHFHRQSRVLAWFEHHQKYRVRTMFKHFHKHQRETEQTGDRFNLMVRPSPIQTCLHYMPIEEKRVCELRLEIYRAGKSSLEDLIDTHDSKWIKVHFIEGDSNVYLESRKSSACKTTTAS